mmetsp:Transcript_7855/g.22472  ORF Transcript_7855/g.22472 Transcript_7855/m.22472 type:complete len:283 (-) Transcript_7855:1303-2151(-)
MTQSTPLALHAASFIKTRIWATRPTSCARPSCVCFARSASWSKRSRSSTNAGFLSKIFKFHKWASSPVACCLHSCAFVVRKWAFCSLGEAPVRGFWWKMRPLVFGERLGNIGGIKMDRKAAVHSRASRSLSKSIRFCTSPNSSAQPPNWPPRLPAGSNRHPSTSWSGMRPIGSAPFEASLGRRQVFKQSPCNWQYPRVTAPPLSSNRSHPRRNKDCDASGQASASNAIAWPISLLLPLGTAMAGAPTLASSGGASSRTKAENSSKEMRPEPSGSRAWKTMPR